MHRYPNRRELLQASAAGLGLSLTRSVAGEVAVQRPSTPEANSYRPPQGFASKPLDPLRLAFVGVGLQGGSHVQNFLRLEGVEIVAICDIDEPRAAEVAGWVVADGRREPKLYTRGEQDYRRLCQRPDVDLVFNSTPWRWHVPICVEAMENGKHAAVEVPATYTIDGCWQLVETAERTRRHCVMMENCCYGQREMMILRMVREGALGELLHAEGAYIHDLRAVKFSDRNEGLWRLEHSVHRNGNLYPTHGIGPLAQCLDINRGDRFDYLVSMSSNARGLELYARERFGADDPRARRRYLLGDMNSSLIRTRLGRTILLQHDTTSPRPYSRINLVQGTRGTVSGYPDRVHLEGRSPQHEWEELASYREEFEHPLWSRQGAAAEGTRHGGMDFLEDLRLTECLRRGLPTDMDVYDAAAWSVLTEVSERSVANGSQPVEVPDFTRGAWGVNVPLGVVA